MMDKVFLDLGGRRLCFIGGFYIDDTFASFQQLQTKYRRLQQHFYHYLPVRHFVVERIPEFTVKPNNQIFYDLLLSQPDSKH